MSRLKKMPQPGQPTYRIELHRLCRWYTTILFPLSQTLFFKENLTENPERKKKGGS